MEQLDLEAVLLIGIYGAGKSSVAAEIADFLEEHDVPFAAIDLDWLAWANLEEGHGEVGERMMLANLAAMVANYRGAGMRRFVLAGAFADRAEIDRLQATLGMPVRVVRLAVPLEVIEARLSASPTSGRKQDLVVAREAFAADEGEGVEDLLVDGTRNLSDIASEIAAWLGWL